METKLTGRFITIAVVLFLALFGLPGCAGGILSIQGPFNYNPALPWFWHQINLVPGIDLNGGTKLLYEIKEPPGGFRSVNGETVAEEVAAALKRRVDPNGVRGLVFLPQRNNNRLEIQLPRSPQAEKSQAVKRAFADAQQALQATNVRKADVVRAVEQMSGPERAGRLDELADGSESRRKLFADLVVCYDKLAAARSNLAAATTAKDAKAIDAAADAGARAEIEYDRLTSQIEATNITEGDIQAILDNPSATERQQNMDGWIHKRYADFPARVAALKAYQTAYEPFTSLSGAIDDTARLKLLLRGSGVLEFHILVDNPPITAPEMIARLEPHGDEPPKGPAPQSGDEMRWYVVDRSEDFGHYTHEFNGKRYALAWTTPDMEMIHRADGVHWSLADAEKSRDNEGRGEVTFRFDSGGGDLFGDLTGHNKDKPLAILLDDRIISAPNISTRITESGVITGNPRTGFGADELDYLVRTLKAGSLPATLADEPLSEQTISPTAGADNLRAGLIASFIGLAVVAVFLIGYYYLAGLVAFFAVVMNLFIIVGMLGLFHATFTLPSIAALVLTVGTAVDANVLIFERLREEQHRGLSLKMALRNAYDRAFSAIIDSNMTTAITSVILWGMGTEEVKGFGLTLLIGILSSMFTALFVTRTIFAVLIERVGIKTLNSFPITFPKWDKLLKPNIDWMRLIWPFIIFSAVFIVAGFGALWFKHGELFDIEFASGTSVQFELKEPMTQEQVRKVIAEADAKSHALPSAGIMAINSPGVPLGTVYEVVTPSTSINVRDAILSAFGDKLKIQLPSKFDDAGATLDQAMRQPESSAAGVASTATPTVFPVEKESLTIDGINVDTTSNVGGVAVVLRHLDPPLSPSEIKTRIDDASFQPDILQKARRLEVDRLDGDVSEQRLNHPATSVVIFMSDPDFPYSKNPQDWRDGLADTAWKIVNHGVNHGASLQKVTNFLPQVANDTRWTAFWATILSIFAIMAYIWFRFGNLKYGTATVVALLHDTVFTCGAIGLAHYVAGTWIGDLLLVEPFRINLTMVAAVLTVMSYSMIDTIVVFDRIRENRGRYGHTSRQVINDSINQTLSRTLLTAGITIIMVGVMYICGGGGIHGFTFVLLVGILVGTYSSIAIAAPILLIGSEKAQAADARRYPVGGPQRIGA